jgi:hypothetical protein
MRSDTKLILNNPAIATEIQLQLDQSIFGREKLRPKPKNFKAWTGPNSYNLATLKMSNLCVCSVISMAIQLNNDS